MKEYKNIIVEEVNGETRIYDENGTLLEVQYGDGTGEIRYYEGD